MVSAGDAPQAEDKVRKAGQEEPPVFKADEECWDLCPRAGRVQASAGACRRGRSWASPSEQQSRVPPAGPPLRPRHPARRQPGGRWQSCGRERGRGDGAHEERSWTRLGDGEQRQRSRPWGQGRLHSCFSGHGRLDAHSLTTRVFSVSAAGVTGWFLLLCSLLQTCWSPAESASMPGTSCWASSSCLPAPRSQRASPPSLTWCWTR